jgi:hypothetical protein
LGFNVGLGGKHAHLARFHAEGWQELAHLRRLAGNPGESLSPGCRFRHRGGRRLPKLGFARRPVAMEGTARPPRLEVFQWLDSPGHVGLEITMAAGFGNAAQPRDIARGDPLTASIAGFHAHVDPWVGMLTSPRPQRLDVGFTTRDVDHRCVPSARVGIHLTSPTLA